MITEDRWNDRSLIEILDTENQTMQDQTRQKPLISWREARKLELREHEEKFIRWLMSNDYSTWNFESLIS